MIFGISKKIDPICGMKEEKGKGIHEDEHWFCSPHCKHDYEEQIKRIAKKNKKNSCCH